jgi:hypothetical protein
VIVFKVVQNSRARSVVHELGSLIEKGGVVLVGFDDKKGLCGIKAGGNLKARCDSTDEKVGFFTSALQNPGQHGARGGFAMCARHGENVLVLQHKVSQPLWA